MIKNSGKVYGMVIYTGKDSKIMKNQGRYKVKKSQIEKQLNLLIVCNIVLLLTLDGLMCGLAYHWTMDHAEKLPYLWTASQIKKSGLYSIAFTASKKLIASYYLLFN